MAAARNAVAKRNGCCLSHHAVEEAGAIVTSGGFVAFFSVVADSRGGAERGTVAGRDDYNAGELKIV